MLWLPLCSPWPRIWLWMSAVTSVTHSSLEKIHPTCSCVWPLCPAHQAHQNHQLPDQDHERHPQTEQHFSNTCTLLPPLITTSWWYSAHQHSQSSIISGATQTQQSQRMSCTSSWCARAAQPHGATSNCSARSIPCHLILLFCKVNLSGLSRLGTPWSKHKWLSGIGGNN